MLLQREERSALNTVTSQEDNYIEINEVRYEHSVCFKAEGPIQAWPVKNVSQVTTEDLILASGISKIEQDPMAFLDGDAPTYKNAPEVLIIGTGKHHRFIDPAILAPLLNARVGIECMTTHAAARTYNVLMSEGRQVAVALILNEE